MMSRVDAGGSAGRERGPTCAGVRVASLRGPGFRLDARHYQQEFALARLRVAHCGYPTLAVASVARAFVPKRVKLVTVASPEAGVPYLRAHDAFAARPESGRFLSRGRTADYDSYLLREGMLVVACSGRNLGPLAYVGRKLAQFSMTDIMRVVAQDRGSAFYLLAYLLTPTGQALIRRGRTGTMVDHLGTDDLESIPVVWLGDEGRAHVGGAMRRAEALLDEGRLALDDLEGDLHSRLGLDLPVPERVYMESSGARCWEVHSSTLGGRLDAEFHSPRVRACRAVLERLGAERLDVAARLRQLGRYKRYYVDRDHGCPILSGRQLLQLRPVNLKYISRRSFRRPEDFVIREGWTLVTCDGRAEEALGSPAYIHSVWDRWMADNHSIRAEPRQHVRPGYLYLALRSPYVQAQLKARAAGSVVDALDPQTIADVLLPMPAQEDRDQLGAQAEDAWEKIARAVRMQQTTVAKLERLIVEGYERPRPRSPGAERRTLA